MKLYDENEKYTEEALIIDSEFSKAIRTIAKPYVEKGYNIRELMHIAAMAVLTMECDFILEKDHKRAKENRDASKGET